MPRWLIGIYFCLNFFCKFEFFDILLCILFPIKRDFEIRLKSNNLCSTFDLRYREISYLFWNWMSKNKI